MNKSFQYRIATDYWLEKTGGLETSEISGTQPPHDATHQLHTLLLDAATTAAIRKICNQQDKALQVFFSAATAILAHRYNGAENLLLAVPGGEAPLFLTAGISKDTTAKALLEALREAMKEAYPYKDYPFEKFAQKYQSQTGPVAQLFNYVVAYTPLTGENHLRTQSALSFEWRSTADAFELDIWYSSKYAAWFIRQMGGHLQRILQQIAAQPDSLISNLALLSEEEQAEIARFNGRQLDFAEKDLSILAMFEQQARLHPEQAAVQFKGESRSYRRLQQDAQAVAALLQSKGIGRGDVVALICERSAHMIAGMLGILQSGAAYLPIDADFPDERIQYILQDSNAKFILSTQQVLDEKQACFQSEQHRIALLDSIPGDAAQNIQVATTAEDTAYIIYTSGSTGRPKGIMVTQGGVSNFVLAYKTVFKKAFSTTDRVLALANISFDASIAEIFVALSSGATLVVLDKERLFDAAKLAAFLHQEQITYAYVPPVLLKDLYDKLRPLQGLALQRMFVGVEPIKDTLLYDYCQLIPGIDIINAYGPTETTVISSVLSYEPLPPTGENVSIGKPIPNYKVYILDNALQVLPAGVPGEICIAGPGVTKGYLNNEALTASKFIDSPFDPGQRMYLSGDLARWTPEGNIVFMGRKDNQVKIRGYRIEPGEIAAVMLNHPAVREAVVAPLEDEKGNRYLCAWFVPSAPLAIADLRQYIAAQLPEYMIPARFMAIDKIPATANGKTDFRKLPRPEAIERTLLPEQLPANELEARLLLIWQELLHMQQIATTDNFFELGGHSLKAAKLATIILRDMHVEIPLRHIFSHATIQQLAAYIQQAEKSVQFHIPVTAESRVSPASFAQRGIYLSYLLNQHATNYNMPTAFAVEGAIDIPQLERALRAVISRQATLRTGFSFTDEVILQHIEPALPFEVPVVQDANPDVQQYLLNFVRPFDLSQPPLLRMMYVRKNDTSGLLLLDMHHIISDGISMGIFLKEMMAAYHNEQLPPLKIQYKDYSTWLDQYKHTPAFARHQQYWLDTFQGKQIALHLPTDFPRSDEKLEGGLYAARVDRDTVAGLKRLINKEGSTLFLLTMAAYNLLLARLTGKKDIIVGTPVAGRVHPDLDPLIGMFVHTLPVRGSVDMQSSFTDLMTELRNTFFTALDHQLYPMEELAEHLQLVRDKNRNPLFDTMFSYHNLEVQAWSTPELSLTPLGLGMKDIQVKFDLSASVTESGGDMQVLFSYSKGLFKESTIAQMVQQYIDILATVAQSPELPLEAIASAPGYDETLYSAVYPLNTTQRDIYMTCLLNPKGGSLRPLTWFNIREEINVSDWEKALEMVTAAEDCMRSELFYQHGEVYQAVRRTAPVHFRFIDISKESADIMAAVRKYADENQDINREYYKHYLFRVDDQHYITATSAHHLFVDGTSFKLLAEKTARAYRAIRNGGSYEESHPPYQQSVTAHLSRFDTPEVENYWRQQLADTLPLSYAGAIASEDKQVSKLWRIQPEESARISHYCAAHGIKPHIFFKAIFTLLTKYHCAADHDFCIRENIAGRSEEHLHTMGVFSYVFPLLVQERFFSGDKTFADLCLYLQQQKRDANPFRHISLALQNQIIGEEELSFFYNYQHYATPDTDMAMGPLQRVYNTIDNHLELRVTEQPDKGYVIRLDFNERIFNGNNFTERMQLLVTQVLGDEQPLQQLQYLTPQELQLMMDFSKNPGEKAVKNVLELFEEQVQQHPDNIAIVFREKEISYAALDKASGAVAAYLQQQGAAAGDIIGIMVERSEWMVIAMLGVMRAGAAYLPIDPDYPQERIDYLLNDSQAKMLLTHASGANAHAHTIILEEIPGDLTLPPTRISPDQLAYVIYTSGTTGKPKGVLVAHHALSNVDLAWRRAYALDQFEPRSLQMASFSFDVFTGEVIRMLTNGGRAIICPAETRLDPVSFYELLTTHRINVLESTPALIAPLMDYAWEHKKDVSFLKLLIVGSDTVPLPYFKTLLERYAPAIRVLNSYGVTETCIDSGFYETTIDALPAQGNTPIGRPLLNYTYYVCNSAGQLLPVGQPGELWIGGEGVTNGYLNRPDTTKEKFIVSPHTKERVYKTGDMVRWLPDGNLEFLGRRDEQVKVRGYRIELKEIENVVLQHPEVKEAAVTTFGAEQEKDMACWYVSQSGAPIDGLKELLKQQLPEYMVPTFFIALPQLPVTHNGKIDKKALHTPLEHIDTHNTVAAAPATATETALLAIWQDVLKRSNIGVTDNFFELGGQSLRAMVLVSRVQKAMAVEISLKDVFSCPTIRQLANRIDNSLTAHYTPIPRTAKQEHYPLSSAQKRVFVISHFKGAEISHNMCDAYWIHGPLDISRLQAAFQTMTDRHESLRTAFKIVDGEPVQVIHDHLHFQLQILQGAEEEAPALLAGFIKKFDLAEAPLLRAAVLSVSADKHLLISDMHHIIGDEVAVGVFVRELWQHYYGTQLAAPAIQYKDYVAWQQSPTYAGTMEQQKQFWMQQLEGELPVLDLPFDHPRGLSKTFDGADHALRIDEQLAAQAIRYVSRKGITMNMLMLAVYNILLSKYTSLEDIIVGTPVAGRTHADLEPVIGMFVNTLALRNQPKAEKLFEQFLDEVKRNALAAYENQDYPFEELVETLGIKRDAARNPVFDILFQYVSRQAREEQGQLKFEPFPVNISVAKFDLTFLVVQSGEQIDVVLNYNKALFADGSIQRFAKHFLRVLSQVLAHPAIVLKDIDLLDDAEIAELKAFGGSPEKDAPRLTIPALWRSTFPQWKERNAVETTAGNMSFEELEQRSEALAIYLQEIYDVKPGHKVALMLQRTLDMPVAILAIIKAGAAYVPIDPSFPAQRIEYILNNSECTMIVADKDYHYSLPLLNIYAERKTVARETLAPVHITPDDLAYIIYTSGSTGMPKGAMLEHINVTSFVRNFEPVYGIVPGDKILAVSNITFDLSVLEILCSLLCGVTVLLANDEELNDFPKVKGMLQQFKVNTLQMTPSRLLLFLNTVGLGALQGIKTVITGGEPVPLGLFRALRRCKQTRVFTSCGPTETCIYSTTDEATTERITIGKPLINEQVFIVGNHGQLQPVNVVGEIYIAGSGVGRGYCNQEALTAEKYFRDEKLSTERIYKSGDIGRWLPDGRIECLGRKDTQVKLRGYRIELGEIESALAKMEGIGMTAAIITTIKGEKQIAAFYESEKEFGYSTIRSFLAERLPSYMLPLFCIRVEKIPLTSNGKTDRKTLDQLAQQHEAAERPFEEPMGALQQTIAAIWKEVLGLERISASDNFFEIGGNSIKLIQALNRIKNEVDITVPLTTAFTYPTIKALAEKITIAKELGSVSAEEFYSVAGGKKPRTLFCFPPAIGYSFIYTALAEYFPDFNICCFHFVESDDRLEQYIQVMDELQPGEPIVMLGYSAGGNFAFEIAKDLEARGREVSDIILIDSYKRWESKAKTEEEIEATINAYYNIVDWSIFSVEPDYLEQIKKNTMGKIEGYCRYMNGKTDTGTTAARMHIVKSKEEWKTPEANRDWAASTESGFYVHQGDGLHPEMFSPEYISHNAGLIAGILEEVRKQVKALEAL
uniref:non-ribosomal peptide synthetase n=1 Tax=Chitinophaga vietnamensis TaxID=2593957 RepID=UPI0011A118AF|nr:non-ribosomal peptide synthetase [Chitinophaga vietnamensis]